MRVHDACARKYFIIEIISYIFGQNLNCLNVNHSLKLHILHICQNYSKINDLNIYLFLRTQPFSRTHTLVEAYASCTPMCVSADLSFFSVHA